MQRQPSRRTEEEREGQKHDGSLFMVEATFKPSLHGGAVTNPGSTLGSYWLRQLPPRVYVI